MNKRDSLFYQTVSGELPADKTNQINALTPTVAIWVQLASCARPS